MYQARPGRRGAGRMPPDGREARPGAARATLLTSDTFPLSLVSSVAYALPRRQREPVPSGSFLTIGGVIRAQSGQGTLRIQQEQEQSQLTRQYGRLDDGARQSVYRLRSPTVERDRNPLRRIADAGEGREIIDHHESMLDSVVGQRRQRLALPADLLSRLGHIQENVAVVERSGRGDGGRREGGCLLLNLPVAESDVTELVRVGGRGEHKNVGGSQDARRNVPLQGGRVAGGAPTWSVSA